MSLPVLLFFLLFFFSLFLSICFSQTATSNYVTLGLLRLSLSVHPFLSNSNYVCILSPLHTHFSDIEYAVYYVSFLGQAYSAALVLFLCVEQPSANLVGLLLPKNS